MAEGAGLSAELYYSQLPVIEGVKEYLSQRIVPDATYRNWNAYNGKISLDAGVDVMEAFSLLPDPQTNGGLLIAVDEAAVDEVVAVLVKQGLSAFTKPVGRMVGKQEKTVLAKQ
jgi:selenide,water dikinase